MEKMASIPLILWATLIAGCQRGDLGRASLPADATFHTTTGFVAVQQDSAPNTHTSTASIQGVPISNFQMVIYYFHPTFRCAACLLAESLAHQVVQEQWKDAVNQGVLQWRLVNIDLPENQKLTQLFEVDSSAVVVTSVRDGKPVRWEKTIEVWEKVKQPDTFTEHINGQIMKFLLDE